MSKSDLETRLAGLRGLYLAWRRAEEEFDCDDEGRWRIKRTYRAFWAAFIELVGLHDYDMPKLA